MDKKSLIKIMIVILLISIVLEGLLVVYNFGINKIYARRHLINNEKIEIDIQECSLSEEDEWGYKYLKYDKLIKDDVYNIELIMKSKNKDAYVRVIYNNNAELMRNSDNEKRVFKAYFSEPVKLDKFEIAFTEDKLNYDNMEKIVVNDNLEYATQKSFSVGQTFLFFIIITIFYLLIKNFKKIKLKENNISQETIFVIIALIIGTIFCYTNLIFTKYDEHAHFWRAYEISAGSIVSGEYEVLPQSIFDVIVDEDGVYKIEDESSYEYALSRVGTKLDPTNTTTKLVGSTAKISPFSYLPQIIGITIGRICNLNPTVIGLYGRFTNLFVYILLIYYAIKLLPNKKWKNILMVIALLPMSLNLAASLSPDATLISTSFLAISYILNLKYRKEKVKWKDTIILGLLIMMATMCKIVYMPIYLLLLLIPKEKFNNNKDRLIKAVAILIMIITPIIIWNTMPEPKEEVELRTNTTEQIYFTLSDPIRDVIVACNTLGLKTPEYLYTMVGGWNTPYIISSIFMVLLFISASYEEKDPDKNQLSKKDKIIIIVVCGIISLLIFAGLYVTWSKAQSMIVEGVQGRYFLPILPLLMMLITNNMVHIEIKKTDLKKMIFMLLLYIPVIFKTIRYFSK